MEELLEISFDLVGKSLEQDIYSELNILLLKKGTVLTEATIVLLKKHNFKTVIVSKKLLFEDLYKKNLNFLKEVFSDLSYFHTQPFPSWFEEDEKLFRFINQNTSLTEEIYSLKNIERNIFTHSANVGIISVIIGKILGYSNKNLKLLWKMGMIHDIGKMKTDTDQHGEVGYEILQNITGIHPVMLDVVRYHHEKIDGSGFPKRLKGNEIPIMVQIVSVANEVEHLFSNSNEVNPFHVMNRLIEDTHKLNPAIVIPFVKAKYSQNIGNQIKLNDGRKAKIIFIHDNEPSQPLIQLEEDSQYIDMRKHHSLKVISLTR
ncbi:HD domain-containing protein [Anaerobacillus alkaliphilus]|uniref:HD domain-containing protein n=1 Tax=Anaerobacillus alkaliphilus TaxID=1548597 RepID=A0A4Q0VU54_9BACI|nr:HD domain-containing protein [Anaerobacillus alkaliphilus]RXI99827.1 HD domain-containing protein [Anaerobacillus alkaliphilus]